MESIEKGYVLVNPHFGSLEAFSDYCEASIQDNAASRVSIHPLKRDDVEVGVAIQANHLTSCHIDGEEKTKNDKLEASPVFAVLRKDQSPSLKQPSCRLDLLHQCVQVLSELSQDQVS